MTASFIPVSAKREWYGLALRHLRMASCLLSRGFSDGAAFHVYHGFECTLSALITAMGYQVPPDGATHVDTSKGKRRVFAGPNGPVFEDSTHSARLALFAELADPSNHYSATFRTLRTFLSPWQRNDTLYLDRRSHSLPHLRYSSAWAADALIKVRVFSHEVWRDIR
jgi:hypothetical protein